jgi:hypothetical protein
MSTSIRGFEPLDSNVREFVFFCEVTYCEERRNTFFSFADMFLGVTCVFICNKENGYILCL